MNVLEIILLVGVFVNVLLFLALTRVCLNFDKKLNNFRDVFTQFIAEYNVSSNRRHQFLEKLESHDKNYLKLMDSARKFGLGGIYKSDSIDEEKVKVNSGGELIPFNLTNEEKDNLRMFYSKEE